MTFVSVSLMTLLTRIAIYFFPYVVQTFLDWV